MLLARSFGKPEHSTISRLQSDAIIDLMKHDQKGMHDMSPDHRAKMSSLAAASRWAAADLQKLMAMMEPPLAKPPRLPMQKATPTILHFFTAEEWDSFQKKGVNLAMSYLITR